MFRSAISRATSANDQGGGSLTQRRVRERGRGAAIIGVRSRTRLLAVRMAARAVRFRVVTCVLAVLTAVLAPFAIRWNAAFTAGMRTFHDDPPLYGGASAVPS